MCEVFFTEFVQLSLKLSLTLILVSDVLLVVKTLIVGHVAVSPYVGERLSHQVDLLHDSFTFLGFSGKNLLNDILTHGVHIVQRTAMERRIDEQFISSYVDASQILDS